MNRIELRGVIVPSEYDSSWAQSYIEKGIIIPESRFRASLANANKKEPLDIYVNSPGGSVFSAGEMVNAVREWKAENKQPVTVTLGALTASAASAFAIMVADNIKAHSNAKMMFHGAWTMSLGGKEMHEDTAELLGKINADIKTRLVSKYGMQPEVVDEWFAEGREGWLSAGEMVQSGLAKEVIEDPSDVIDFPQDALGEIENRGIGIAAFLAIQNNQESTEENEKGIEDDNPQDDGNADAGASNQDDEPKQSNGDVDAGESVEIDATSAYYKAGIAAGKADAASEIEQLTTRVEELEQSAKRLQSEKDKARAATEKLVVDHENKINEIEQKFEDQIKKIELNHTKVIENMTAEMEKLQERNERLVSGGLKFSPSADNAKRTAADVDPRNRLHPALR